MFNDATVKASNYAAPIEEQLYNQLDSLDKTASTWYDQKSETVESRMHQLSSVAGLCRRVAAMTTTDQEDSDMLLVISSNFSDQVKQLQSLAVDLKSAERSAGVGNSSPAFSSLADESRTASSVDKTDWNLFMEIEPKLFAQANSDADEREMQIRALGFIDDAMNGQSLSRDSKKKIAKGFLTRVAFHTPKKTVNKVAAKEPEMNAADSVLLFV